MSISPPRPHTLPLTAEGLPVIATCSGCGACCLEQGAPPDYVALTSNADFSADPSFADDADRLRRLPAEARALLDLYLDRSARGLQPHNGACVWYDPATTSCRFYDWRPSTCRVFEMNSPGCRIYRQRQGIDLPCRPGSATAESPDSV